MLLRELARLALQTSYDNKLQELRLPVNCFLGPCTRERSQCIRWTELPVAKDFLMMQSSEGSLVAKPHTGHDNQFVLLTDR
jgi:hypothetical protein